ncbi:23005_t:CDS:2, partial [Racocetra persica]
QEINLKKNSTEAAITRKSCKDRSSNKSYKATAVATRATRATAVATRATRVMICKDNRYINQQELQVTPIIIVGRGIEDQAETASDNKERDGEEDDNEDNEEEDSEDNKKGDSEDNEAKNENSNIIQDWN